MELRINCAQCNAPLIAAGTFDRGAEFVTSLVSNNNKRIAAITSDRTDERKVYVCSNAKCIQHSILRNEDGTPFQM